MPTVLLIPAVARTRFVFFSRHFHMNPPTKSTHRQRLAVLAVLCGCIVAADRAHAASNIFSGPDQQTPGAVSQNAPNPLSPEGLNDARHSIFERDLLLGDFNGAREQLLFKGVSISPNYIGEVMGNPTGGLSRGVTYDGVLNVPLDVDLERVTGFLHDLTFHANALWIHGQGLSTRHVGDFSNTSNIAGYNTVRLQELWFEQQLWRKRISLRAGVLAADAEFFTTGYGSLFLNGTFGAFTLVGANLPDPPIYPVAAPGVRLEIRPVSKFLLRAGIFGGDSGGSQDQNNHGTNFNLRSRDGALVFSEINFFLNQSPGERGLVGTYKLGAFVHTGGANLPTFTSQTNAALGVSGIRNASSNYGIYGVIDQQLLRAGGRSVGAFLRVGGAPSDVSFVDFYVDGGFNFTGFVPGRPIDVLGLAVAHSSVSGKFSDSQRLQGLPGFSAETVLEATYRLILAPWWNVQPDLQYIFHPGGQHGSHDALVLGMRTSVAF